MKYQHEKKKENLLPKENKNADLRCTHSRQTHKAFVLSSPTSNLLFYFKKIILFYSL